MYSEYSGGAYVRVGHIALHALSVCLCMCVYWYVLPLVRPRDHLVTGARFPALHLVPGDVECKMRRGSCSGSALVPAPGSVPVLMCPTYPLWR